MKNFIFVLSVVLLISCAKKKNDPSPSTSTTPSYDTTAIIGTWQLIKESGYDTNPDGTLYKYTIILNDSIAHDGVLALEFTTKNSINRYVGEFYDSWGKDTVLVTTNYTTYQFVNNNTSIKFDPIILINGNTMNIATLNSTTLVLRKDSLGSEGEVTFKKIQGHAFENFTFVQ